jgi:hypothetical protein
MEESGAIRGPVERDPTGDYEFLRPGGQRPVDIKSFRSDFPPGKGGYELNAALQNIQRKISGSDIVVNTEGMSPSHVEELSAATRKIWGDRVMYWPPK